MNASTPWRVIVDKAEAGSMLYITDAANRVVAYRPDGRPEGEKERRQAFDYAVLCVNTHDELIRCCERLISEFAALALAPTEQAAIAEARAAASKARGES